MFRSLLMGNSSLFAQFWETKSLFLLRELKKSTLFNSSKNNAFPSSKREATRLTLSALHFSLWFIILIIIFLPNSDIVAKCKSRVVKTVF